MQCFVTLTSMKLEYFFVLGLFLAPFFVSAGDISQIIFTNDTWTAKPNEAALLTIQLQYAGDSHPTVCMKMFTDSSTGQFSSSDTNWNSVDKLTINSNWTNKNFYYKDSMEGVYTLTVKVIPISCSALTDEEARWTVSQNITVSSEDSFVPSVDNPDPDPPFGGGSEWPEYVSPEDRPKITAYAGKDKVMIVGALGEFRGEGYDFDNEPIEKARYLWNFGDGTLKDGQNISHFYRYPGEYIVTLDVSSGGNSSSDRLLVKAIPNKIIISEVKTGTNSFIELYNGSKEEINISGWQIRSSSFIQKGHQTFNLPKNTFIKSFGYSVFPVFLSEMILPQGGGKVELLYQTGLSADTFTYIGFLSEDQSFSISDTGQSYMAEETPGTENIKSVVATTQNIYSGTEKQEASKNYESGIMNYEKEKEPEKIIENEIVGRPEDIISENQQANVITIADDNLGIDKTKLYLLVVLGFVFFAGLGTVVVRRLHKHESLGQKSSEEIVENKVNREGG